MRWSKFLVLRLFCSCIASCLITHKTFVGSNLSTTFKKIRGSPDTSGLLCMWLVSPVVGAALGRKDVSIYILLILNFSIQEIRAHSIMQIR